MPRPIVAIVSRRAIADNLRVVRRIAPRASIWAVIKADAYGHGLLRVAAGSERAFAGADGMALLDLADAIALSDAGCACPILLLEGCF